MTEDRKPDGDAASARMAEAVAAVGNYVHTVLNCSVRGIIDCLTKVPAEVLLPTICRVMGQIVGQTYGGEQEHVTKLRNVCRQAFNEAMRQTPIPQVPAEAPKPVMEDAAPVADDVTGTDVHDGLAAEVTKANEQAAA